MRIGIFTDVLSWERSGIGWHVTHLLDNLAAIDRENEYYLFYLAPTFGRLPELYCPAAPNFRNVAIRGGRLTSERLWRLGDRMLIPSAVRRLRIDVFHGPNHYVPPAHSAANVLTIHDLAHIKLDTSSTDEPTRSRDRQLISACLKRAARVIAVSECTKRDIVEFGYPASQIDVIYEGGNVRSHTLNRPLDVTAIRDRWNLPGRYVLFVGTVHPRKNLPCLVRAYKRMRDALGHSAQLVIAGANDTDEYYKVKSLCQAIGIDDHVTFTGYLSTDEINALYQGASAFVIPSFYEGFGMVAVEAMHYGVPVIASRGGALEEIVADAGIMVNVNDESALANAIGRVLTDEQLADDLARRGELRAKSFHWRQTAERTLATYRRCAAKAVSAV